MKSKEAELFKKIYRVIESCETEIQLANALKYLRLARNNKYILEEFYISIYFNIFLRKLEEINGDVA